MYNSFLVKTGIFLLIVLLFTHCQQPAGNGEKNTKEEPVVNIAFLNLVVSLPWFIVEEKGYLEEVNVQYKAVQLGSSNMVADAVISGNADYGVSISAVPVLAAETYSPGKAKVFSVTQMTKEQPFDALLTKEDNGITELAHLVGKKVGVFPGSTATAFLKKFLSGKEVDISNTTFVPIPPPNQLAALKEGSIDALFAYEPGITIGLNMNDVRELYGSVYAEMISPNPQGVAVVNSAFATAHPKLNKRVISAFDKAYEFMQTHEAEARQILQKRLKLSDEIADKVYFSYMCTHDKIDKAIFQQYTDLLTELGEIKKKLETAGMIYQ